jgi:hypothetical protein
MSTVTANWLRTPMAAVALGCSQNHLKRCRDSHGGFLVHGEHYILGISHSAPIIWNVEAVRAAFHQQGLMRQQRIKQTIQESQAQ